MPPVEKKRRNKRFADWEEKPVKDFDPENEVPDESENSGSEDSADERAGTEHYVSVGKSKLRQKESVDLGREYRGARVSRAALEHSSDEDDDEEDEDEEEEEFADPDTADLEADHVDDDVEISSDDALADSDNEKLKDFVFRGSSKPLKPLGKTLARRPKAADFMDVEESEEDEGEGSEEGVLISGRGEEDDDDMDDISEESDMEDYSGEEEEDSEIERDGALLFDDEASETDRDTGDDEDEEDEDDDEDEDESGEDEEGDEEGDEDEDEEEEDGEEEDGDDDADDARAQLRKAMSEGQKKIVDTISQAAKQDAEKGVAVRTQRRAFDSILNLRIRLQKALVAVNTFTVVDKEDSGSEAYQAAEEAAVKLWNTIDSVRETLLPPTKAKAGEKRKREAITVETSSQDIWESMQGIESVALSHRRKVLDKWSARVRTTAAASAKTRRLGESASQSLVSVLEDQLLSTDRLVKRARTPRSCAPAQAAKKVEEDKDIYDDADFYQLLLKELVDQRSTDAAAPGGEHVATVRWAALKEAKTRKQVDRKASKGRKLRYTAHEKLQNFMAPEDRRQWEEHAIDRFFGALFGQKMVLKEDAEEEDEDVDEEMGGVNVEEEGLRLFRG